MLREDFLQQFAYHEIDRYCPVNKSYWMLKLIMDFYRRSQEALEANIALEKITGLAVIAEIARMKELSSEKAEKQIQSLMDKVRFSFAELGVNEHA
jgi:V/A-type H+-transporting ATPase subunit A